MFGVQKKARATREALQRANRVARSWTVSPDGEEFYARYFNDLGYAVLSFERGMVALTRRSKDLVTAAREIASSVEHYGAAWEPGPLVRRFEPPRPLPDPRRVQPRS
jgi:hypothetical protein